MGKEKYLYAVTGKEGTTYRKVVEGERIKLSDGSFIVVGVTSNENIPSNIKIEPLTKENKYKLPKKKLLTFK